MSAAARRRGGSRRRIDPGPDTWEPTEKWKDIAVGSVVEVQLPAGHSYVGQVETKTPDSAVVWVLGTSGLGRQMFGNRDGVRLRPLTGKDI